MTTSSRFLLPCARLLEQPLGKLMKLNGGLLALLPPNYLLTGLLLSLLPALARLLNSVDSHFQLVTTTEEWHLLPVTLFVWSSAALVVSGAVLNTVAAIRAGRRGLLVAACCR